MPFEPLLPSERLRTDLLRFADSHDFVALYKSYSWWADTWENGFPEIFNLETNMRGNIVTRDHVLSVVAWARGRFNKEVICPKTLTLPLYEKSLPDPAIEARPLVPLTILEANTKGLGPTRLSKVLRFALPAEFGALDSNIVRVVGLGDPISKRQTWLSLRACYSGSGWSILKTKSAWPAEYSTWINILRFFAKLLNGSNTLCPHPEAFIANHLRTPGHWECADVEMALFRYASSELRICR